MTRIPTPVLHLLHDAPVAESPAMHIRNASQALVLADARLAEWLPAASGIDSQRRGENVSRAV